MALERTRKAYHLYGHAELVGSEVETLSNFVIQILIREMLDDAFSSIRSSSQRADAMKSAKSVVEGIVAEASTATWNKCVQDALKVQDSLRSSIGNNMSLVLDVEETVSTALKVETVPIIRPVMNDALSDTVIPFVSVLFQHVLSAHSAAVSGLWCDLRKWIARCSSRKEPLTWDWKPAQKQPGLSKYRGIASPDPSSGVKFDAREDTTWKMQYQKYGDRERLGSVAASPGGSPGIGNSAYMRNKSFTGADAQPIGTPLRKAASICYDIDIDRTTPRSPGIPISDLSDSSENILQKRVSNELFKCHVSVDDVSGGPLHDSAIILWNLYTTDLANINGGALSETLSAYEVYTYYLDSLQALLHNAIYTLELMASSLSDEGLTPDMMLGLVNDVTRDLIIDAQKSMVEGIIDLSHDLIRCTCQEIIEDPCLYLGPLFASKILAEISDALSIDNIIERTIQSDVRGILSKTLTAFVNSQRKREIDCPF